MVCEVQSAGSFLDHPRVVLIGYQLATEQVPVKNLFFHCCCFAKYTFLHLHPITFPSVKKVPMALEVVPPMTLKNSLFIQKAPCHCYMYIVCEGLTTCYSLDEAPASEYFLLLIVSWPQLKGTFHLHICLKLVSPFRFFLRVVSSGFVVALAIIILSRLIFLTKMGF